MMKAKFRISYQTVFVACLILVFGMLIWHFSEDILSIFRGEVSLKEVFLVLGTSDQSSVPTTSSNRDSDNTVQKISMGGEQSSGYNVSAEDQTIQLLNEFAKNSGVLDEKALSSLQTLVDFQGLRDPFENLLATSESKTTTKTTTDKTLVEAEDLIMQRQPSAEDRKPESGSSISFDLVTVDDKGSEDKNITYEELLQQLAGEQSTESPNLSPVEHEIVYPPFVLKGIAAQANKIRAIIQYQANSLIIDSGQQIEDWTIQAINSSQIVITNFQNQRFILTLEGVVFDDEKD